MPTLNFELELALPAARLWEALKDINVIFPKIAPHAVASMDVIEGSVGEVGSISLIKFGPIAPEGSYAKEKLVSIDHDSRTVVSAEIEGGHLLMGFTKWQSAVKISPLGDDKAKMEISIDYDGQGPLIEAGINQAKEGVPQMFKGLEAFLLTSGDYPKNVE